jgi:hypothetical protein
MRRLITSVLLAWVCSRVAADPAAKCDLSTDAGIDAAYHAATSKTIDSYGGRCVHRSETFPNMVAIGSFVSDRGCEWLGTLHGCLWNDAAAARKEMAAAGWAKADTGKRQTLAHAWLNEVEQIRTEDEKVSDDHGKPVIDYWVTGPTGMTPEPPERTHHRVVFAADGTHGAIATL